LLISLLIIPENESVAISSMVADGAQLFIASNSDVNGWPTITDVHDSSGSSPIISGGVVHNGGPTT
jgi:hypothetical protein